MIFFQSPCSKALCNSISPCVYNIHLSSIYILIEWFTGVFTCVCVCVQSESELNIKDSLHFRITSSLIDSIQVFTVAEPLLTKRLFSCNLVSMLLDLTFWLIAAYSSTGPKHEDTFGSWSENFWLMALGLPLSFLYGLISKLWTYFIFYIHPENHYMPDCIKNTCLILVCSCYFPIHVLFLDVYWI